MRAFKLLVKPLSASAPLPRRSIFTVRRVPTIIGVVIVYVIIMSLGLQVTLAERPVPAIVVHSVVLWRGWLLCWRHSQLDITRMGRQYRGHGFGLLIGQLAPPL